ncbi:translational GTPase TypA [Candidatus Woesebacteria bacterium]|nr:translational GTPase TypA [Candidatus Woesebacteria bacterium]MCD8546402.1 translational GTPase TypA [Candidatus Woesebacteria bacterium]
MDIRNIAIIAHVDHGKTTLVDGMLKQTHTFRDNQAEMEQTTILDRNELERERGITILAKNTAVQYGDTKINIIDTPGHADFSGEVERVISMADGALLIVDAAEGPLPQTKFVLRQALKQKLSIIVVLNKIDRGDARPEEVLNETEELFLELAENEGDLAFPVLYAVARDGKVWNELPSDFNAEGSLEPLFQKIVEYIPAPQVESDKPFKMLVSTLDFDSYKGTYSIGKVTQGTVKPGKQLVQLAENEVISKHSVQQVFTSQGLERVEVQEAQPGDIVALTGIDPVKIGHTLADPQDPTGYPIISLSEPTMKIYIGPNTSPISAKEGEYYTARQLEARLEQEKQTNIGLRIETNPDGHGWLVAGRGELHLSVLIENLRREGYELEVGQPQVITLEKDGVTMEPAEEVSIEVESEHMGAVVEEMGRRRADMVNTAQPRPGLTRLTFHVASKNLLGLRSELLTRTRGTAIINSQFLEYRPLTPALEQFRNGAIIATESGQSTGYALESIEKRGETFIGPGEAVYEGMIIGMNRRQEDIDMNATKAKNLTNHRSANADILTTLKAPRRMTLEQCLDFIQSDELLEVTPLNLRLRKRHLSKLARVRASK